VSKPASQCAVRLGGLANLENDVLQRVPVLARHGIRRQLLEADEFQQMLDRLAPGIAQLSVSNLALLSLSLSCYQS